MTSSRSYLIVFLVVAALGLGACGGSGTDSPTTTIADAAVPEGESIALKAGCAACHGNDFDGGIGPTWIGLSGSTVTLADGSTVVADEAYLFEAIKLPSLKIVDGYNDIMPESRLSDDEIDAVVEFISSL